MFRGNSKQSNNENFKTPKPEYSRNDAEKEDSRPKKTTKKPIKEEEGSVRVESKTKSAKGGSDTKAKPEKKVYILPGQKHDPPEERDAARLFYSSLHRQIPSSEMAEVWMMEHGLLSPETAKKVYEKKKKKHVQPKASTKSSRKKDLSDDDMNVQPKALKKSSLKKDFSDDDKKVQPKVSTKSIQKKDLSNDDKKMQPKDLTKSSLKKDISDDKKLQPRVSTKSILKKDLSADYKKVQPKVATKSSEKKYILDNDKKIIVSKQSRKKIIVFSDDDSDDFIQPKKLRRP